MKPKGSKLDHFSFSITVSCNRAPMSSVSSSKGVVDVDVTQLGQGGSERIDFLLACFGLNREIKIIYKSNSTE